MTRDERVSMFGDGIPDECYIHHDWRRDVVTLGTVPGSFIEEVSGASDWHRVQVNRRFAEGSYDLILRWDRWFPTRWWASQTTAGTYSWASAARK